MPKISDLNELNQISDDDVLVINALVDGKNTTLKIKRSVLLNGLAKQSSIDVTNTNITNTNKRIDDTNKRVSVLEELGLVKKNGVLFCRHRKES